MDSNIENIINISNTIIRTFLHTFIDDVVNAAVGLDLEVFFFLGGFSFVRVTYGRRLGNTEGVGELSGGSLELVGRRGRAFGKPPWCYHLTSFHAVE